MSKTFLGTGNNHIVAVWSKALLWRENKRPPKDPRFGPQPVKSNKNIFQTVLVFTEKIAFQTRLTMLNDYARGPDYTRV